MSAEVFSEEDERLIVTVVLDIAKRARDGERISPEEADIARKVLGPERTAGFGDFLAAQPINAKTADAKSLMVELSRLQPLAMNA